MLRPHVVCQQLYIMSRLLIVGIVICQILVYCLAYPIMNTTLYFFINYLLIVGIDLLRIYGCVLRYKM